MHARPLSIQEVSRKKLGWKKVTIPKCEISLRGVWPHYGGQMSHFIPRNFWGPPTRTRRRRNFLNIFRGQGVINEKRKKNVNGRKMETGSGRGQVTSDWFMSCVSLVDVDLEMSTLFEFEVFPNPPCNGMQW